MEDGITALSLYPRLGGGAIGSWDAADAHTAPANSPRIRLYLLLSPHLGAGFLNDLERYLPRNREQSRLGADEKADLGLYKIEQLDS